MEISINPNADTIPTTLESLASSPIRSMEDLEERCAKLERDQFGFRVGAFLDKQAKAPNRKTDMAGVFTTDDGEGIYYCDEPDRNMAVVIVDNRFADQRHRGRLAFTVWLINISNEYDLTDGKRQKIGDFKQFDLAYTTFLKQIKNLTPIN